MGEGLCESAKAAKSAKKKWKKLSGSALLDWREDMRADNWVEETFVSCLS
jgi:hypothetical protein